jgi:signal peptidase II
MDAAPMTDTANPPSEPSAICDLGAQLRFWCVVAAGLAIDLWSKYWSFHTLGQGGRRVLIPSVLEFHTTLNPGALFGLGKGQTTLFVIASLLALGLVLWMFAQCPSRRWLTQIALGAILAGALGNMYDRVFVRLVPHEFHTESGRVLTFCTLEHDGEWLVLREYPPLPTSRAARIPVAAVEKQPAPVGYVRDFIKISQKWFGGRDVWPWVFNVADMLLVGGVGILAVRMLRERRSEEAAGGAELDAAGGKS